MKVLIRADASSAIGVGHLMRCLTLAQQLKRLGVDITFACRDLSGHLFSRILGQGHQLIRLSGQYPDSLFISTSASITEPALNWEDDFAALSAQLAVLSEVYDWLIVDHYGLDAQWERAMRRYAQRIAVIDDLYNRPHDADILLDQNLSADLAAYRALVSAECQLLLGPKYALLRPEFAGGAIEIKPKVERILVNFGGADPTGEMFKVMAALQLFPDVSVDFVAGASNAAWPQLQRRAIGQRRWHLQSHTDDFAALMRNADLFIGAAGSTSWERAALGLPSICMAVADNQIANARLMNELGAHGYLGEAANVSVNEIQQAIATLSLTKRQQWAQVSKQLVDGFGTGRVLAALLRPSLKLRVVEMADAQILFDARNAPQVRQQSIQSEPLQWGEHCAWLQSRIGNSETLLLMGEALKTPIGVVRFDRVDDDVADVSIYLLADQFNLGWGRYLLEQAQVALQMHWPAMRLIRAVIKDDNAASLALFARAGYEKQTLFYTRTLGEK